MTTTRVRVQEGDQCNGAQGETTSATAEKFRVSLGRISQLRRELRDDWEQFHGEAEEEVPVEHGSGANLLTCRPDG